MTTSSINLCPERKKHTVIVSITLHVQTNLIKQCNFIHLSLRSLLQGENTASIDESRKQSVRTSLTTSWIWHSPFHYLVRIRHRLLFEFQQKKRQIIASSSWWGISSNFLASLRCTYVQPSFVLLEMFWFWFLLPRLASSSSDNVGNLSFSLLLLKSSIKMENFGNFPATSL